MVFHFLFVSGVYFYLYQYKCVCTIELNKPSQPAAGERSSSHPRPFFYVQPAVQPFYTYQWHMNHPYGQHGFPGSGKSWQTVIDVRIVGGERFYFES